LPTKKEWDEIAKRVLKSGNITAHKNFVAAPNKGNKILHLQDNVSELVAEQNIVKGLNVSNLKDKGQTVSMSDVVVEQEYVGASPYVGFRCVANVVNGKN